MITIDKLIIVEGKYDKIKLSNIIDAPILETNGFRIFKDKEKQRLIREIAKKKEILIITDSDSAGFVIRNHLKNIIKDKKIYNAYIPQIVGKEKRKDKKSKEGILGVEGIGEEEIIKAIEKSGALCKITEERKKRISKMDFYEMGLCGKEDSKKRREELLASLGLPKYLSTNATIEAMELLYTREELEQKVCKLNKSN